ncbi:hypothetical protein HCN44_003630 [Aphidius gifuensis]|uniref:Uncharacterized protein n=1 Tax=Aphidius gifuensis TaxID=684658 RepID=A0A835CL05_APHGI|nr:hypothetical protein HCN44_003630 [Aphidius gifuensis]
MKILFFIYLIFRFKIIYANNYWITSAKLDFEEPKFTIVNKIDNCLQDIITVENNMTIVRNNLENKISNLDQQSIEDNQKIVDKLNVGLNKIFTESKLVDLYRCRKAGQNDYSKIYGYNDYKNTSSLKSHKQSHTCSMLTSIFKNDCTDEKIFASTLDLIEAVKNVLDKAVNYTNEVNQFTQNITQLCSLEELYKNYENKIKSCIIKKDYK